MDKPFIHLLRSPNSGYFFDVNRNEIVPVDDETYRLLEQWVTDVTAKMCSQIEELINNGYLSDNHVKKLFHPYTDMVPLILDRNIRKMTLQLTQACNLSCRYCPFAQSNGSMRKHSKNQMTLELGQKAILFLRNHSIDQDEVDIGFYGGEPLLETDLLKKLTLFAEQVFMGKKISFSLTSNMTLLTNDLADFFEAHNFHILLSIDGIRKIHDKNRVFANRKGSYDIVLAKMNDVIKSHKNLAEKIMINMVINPLNDFDDINLFFNESAFSEINVQSTILDDIGLDKQLEFSNSYIEKSTYQMFLGNLSLLNLCPFSVLSPIIKQNLSTQYRKISEILPRDKLPTTSIPGGQCVPGELRMMVIYSGEFVVCEKVNEQSDCMKIGDVKHGFDFNKIAAIMNVSQLASDSCLNCWAFTYCGACARYADNNGQLSKNALQLNCEDRKANLEYLLRKKILIEEQKYYTSQRV